jgi:hypothetical protein
LTASSLVFLTPRAALVALAFAVPMAAFGARELRATRVRRGLRLRPPSPGRRLARVALLLVVGALVAVTAAQPALRDTDTRRMRSDAELYLTFDVTRSMLARPPSGGQDRLDRARVLAARIHRALADVPTGVATVTNRMMPLLFPTRDRRAVNAVVEHSLEIMQPPPALIAAPRATALGALGLVADRTYFDSGAHRRALIVFSDLDTDTFSLGGTLEDLRRRRIAPFVIRVASPGERVFGADGRIEPYRPTSTLAVRSLRAAGWSAYEEGETAPAVRDIERYLGQGPTAPSGVIETQRPLATATGLAALAMTVLLVAPSLLAGLARPVRLRRSGRLRRA